MAKMTPGNHLFFYQLFSEQLGVGKQTPLQRVEEVLAEADVLLDDVECETVDQLVEALADFLKLTVFKKGRVFVTVMQSDELDALLEKAAQPVVDKAAAAAGKSWKKARRSKDVRPTKPRHKRKPAAPVVEEEPVAEATDAMPIAEPEVAAMPEPASAPGLAEAAEPQAGATTTEVPVPEAEATPEAEAVVDATPKPEPETTPTPEATSEPAPAQEPELESQVDVTPEPEPMPEPASEPEVEPAPQPTPTPEPQPESQLATTPRNPRRIRTTPKLRRISLPQSISTDVHCPDELLLKLYQLLPDTIGLMEALDEGWEYAQQAGTIEGTRSQMTFPLSRTNRPGYPIEVTIRRSARIPSGQAWLLTQVTRLEDDEEVQPEPAEAASEHADASSAS